MPAVTNFPKSILSPKSMYWPQMFAVIWKLCWRRDQIIFLSLNLNLSMFMHGVKNYSTKVTSWTISTYKIKWSFFMIVMDTLSIRGREQKERWDNEKDSIFWANHGQPKHIDFLVIFGRLIIFLSWHFYTLLTKSNCNIQEIQEFYETLLLNLKNMLENTSSWSINFI